MSTRIRLPIIAVIALSAPVFLAGCAGVSVGGDAEVPDPRFDKLVSGMDQCLSNQAQMAEQLQRQEQLLDKQQQQLAALQADSVPDVPGAETALVCEDVTERPDKLLVGQLEQVWLPELKLSLPARIDTGAETASLDARNIELFERNSRRWVRFEILHPESGEPIPLERKLKRMVVILQSNTAEPERRPVIRMGITIGHISQTAEFTLSNRSHLDYQILVGRNVLKDYMVVDVSGENIAPLVVTPEGEQSGAGQ